MDEMYLGGREANKHQDKHVEGTQVGLQETKAPYLRYISAKIFYIVGSLSLLSIITIVLEIAFYVYFHWIT